MAPNISNKSVYIIFIISINIVSMVCHYQPIKISHLETERQKYYLYQDYLDEETEYSDKLDYEQFFNSIFNPEYKFSHQYDNKPKMRLEIQKFCNDDNKFIPFIKYKRMYQIMLLGREVRKFRECIKSDTIKTFDVVKVSYTNIINTSWTIAQLLDKNLTSNQRTELQKCLNNFTEPIKNIFNNLNKSEFEFDLYNKTIGTHVNHLMRIVTSDYEDDYFTDNDKDKKLKSFQYFYKEITQYGEIADVHIENAITYTVNEKMACQKYYKTNTIDYYVPMPEIFEGLDNYNDFIKHSEIKIKYLQTLEGPLINNKELYEIYLAHPITLNDYEKLRKPIPLFHETMYSVYSLRLQKLGYLPLHENTWTTVMNKLLWNPDWDVIFSKQLVKKYIEDIMKMEDNGLITMK